MSHRHRHDRPKLNPEPNSTKYVCPCCGESLCDNCGNPIRRFVHGLRHPQYPLPMFVCGDCATSMTGRDFHAIERRMTGIFSSTIRS
jgi:hypothetical protein